MSRAPTVLAVDGNSLAHRAFHALRHEELGGAWMTHGFVRMLATAWDHRDGFDAVLVAFDSDRNARQERWAPYKGNRADKEPEFHDQFARLREIVAACGFGDLVTDGYEADDVLAAVAAAATSLGARCCVLSSDRDLTALVSDAVTLLRPRHSMNDLLVYDPAAVEAEYGVPPERYVELAALRGDVSDNLPGVDGIGQKTAAKLLRSFGGLEALYDGLRWLPYETAKRLRAGRSRVERNLDLMAPMGEHDVDVAGALDRGIDEPHVLATLRDHGLRAAATSFHLALHRELQPPRPPPPGQETVDHDDPELAPVLVRAASLADGPVAGEQASLF